MIILSVTTSLRTSSRASWRYLYFSGSLKMARVWLPSHEWARDPPSSSVNVKLMTCNRLPMLVPSPAGFTFSSFVDRNLASAVAVLCRCETRTRNRSSKVCWTPHVPLGVTFMFHSLTLWFFFSEGSILAFLYKFWLSHDMHLGINRIFYKQHHVYLVFIILCHHWIRSKHCFYFISI